SEVEINGGNDGSEGVRSVNVVQRRSRRDGAGPFQIEIGFDQIAGDAGIGSAVEHYGGIGRGQVEARAEAAEVAEQRRGLANDGDALACAIDACRIERSEIVNRAEVFRREGVAVRGG